jgi:muramoyltetrapeptide carboxypeptidase
MHRRQFFSATGLAVMASGLSTSSIMAANETFAAPPPPRLRKPAALREGATVALVAPGSPISEEKIAKSLLNLAALGLKVKEGQHWRARLGYLAGTDAERLADLHRAFADPEVEAVWCARGGYGCGRLLHLLDYGLIRRNPKIFIGYSDITALHLAIHQRTGLVTFHGPVAASDYPENTLAHLKAAIFDKKTPYALSVPADDETLPGEEHRPFVIAPGRAAGPLVGGNLALLSALAGTPWAPSFRGKIAFIEDIGEQPYRLDRMLTQLLQATDLAKAAGIALGVFTDCQPKGESLSLPDALRDRLGSLGIPVAYGFPFGHVAHQATLPYGIRAEIDTERGTLTLLESAVS